MSTKDDISTRKSDHIKLCLDEGSQGHGSLFESVDLPYKALPEINLSDVSTKVKLLNKILSQPLIISSMTGGTKHGIKINTNLAKAAESQKIALGVGSQRIALEKPEAIETFKVIRKNAPTAFIFANMGAIQLNNGRGVDDYRRIVDMIDADALYLHINPLQEAMQPGGDTNYAGLTEKIRTLVAKIGVPVFVKEVGHGIDLESAKKLIDCGVSGIDVAGVGGTSYAWVEAERTNNHDYSSWFKEIGTKTEESIRSIAPIKGKTTLVASGGLRSPVEGYKAHMLGADLYASTRPFLQAAMLGFKDVEDEVKKWQRGLQVSMFSAGAEKW